MKNKVYFISLILLCLGFLQPASASPRLRVNADGSGEVIALENIRIAPRKVFTLTNPDRLVIDIPSFPEAGRLAMPEEYDGDLIKKIRGGQFNAETSRLVFDLNAPASVAKVVTDSRSLRVTIAEGKAVAARKPPPKKEKPLIVIDAGHGGQDPGTIGRYKTQEKDLVLRYARALQAKLLNSGRYRVLLTRENDRFIVLRERVAVARKAKADLFISIHADSAPAQTARGLSVYTLSETASDKEAAALAERENRADIIAGIDLSGEREDVADILISLAQRETNNMSATFADMVVLHAQKKNVPLLPNPHRFAGFAVLKAPDIPSVLIETGFLSNAGEEKQLKTKAYQDKVVSGIVSGIDAFFDYKKELGGE